jgi:hypothetical protein
MKVKINGKSAAAIIAVLSMSNIALADSAKQFTPVENLTPEQRQEVYNKISNATQDMEIDWDSIALGMNEKGQPTLIQKNQVEMVGIGQPSCFSGTGGVR